MGWSITEFGKGLYNAGASVVDAVGVAGSTVATGLLKTSELIPGVDYSEIDTIQSLYKNSDRMVEPIVSATAPIVDWTAETGIPGAGEVLMYVAIIPTTAVRYAGEAVGRIDKDSEFSKKNDERLSNIAGYGNYVINEPVDALGQAGQGLVNAGTTTVGLVLDVGRGAINYVDDAVVGIHNLGYENPEEKVDDFWHIGGESFFATMEGAKDFGTFMPAISDQVMDSETGLMVDNPYAKYQRITRYSTQAVGEVGAMVLTGGSLGAVWGAARGAKVTATVARAGEEVLEVAAKTTAKATEEVAEAVAKTSAKAVEETAEATVKASANIAEETVEATAKTTATTAETTVKAAEETAEEIAKAAPRVEIVAEEGTKTTLNASTAVLNETAEDAVVLTANRSSRSVTSTVANVSDDAAVEVTQVAGNTAKSTNTADAANETLRTFNTSARAANETMEEAATITANGSKATANAADDVAVEITEVGGKTTVIENTAEAANEAAETFVRVRGVEGAQEGFKNGMAFMSPFESKFAFGAEAAGVTASMYMETSADIKAAEQRQEDGKQIIDDGIDSMFEGYDPETGAPLSSLSTQFPQGKQQSSLNTEFSNRATATQQPLEQVNGTPLFTLALSEDDAVKFTNSLKV